MNLQQMVILIFIIKQCIIELTKRKLKISGNIQFDKTNLKQKFLCN